MYMYSCKYLNLQWKDLQLFAKVAVNKVDILEGCKVA